MNINRTILMSDADNLSTEQPINPYYHKDGVNRKKANQELSEIKELLTKAGTKIISIPSPAGCQDGIYTANWALVRDKKAVMSCLPNARKCEENYAEKVLNNLGIETVHPPEGLKFSGQGDALACGNYLFCGSNYRSDETSQKFAAYYLEYERIQLQTVPQTDENDKPIINSASGWPDSYYYDIDMALAIIKEPSDNERGLIAYCPEAFQSDSRDYLDSFNEFDKIIVSLEETKGSFATNLISTGETVLMSAHAPKLSENLISHGLKVLTPDMTEISKGGGYIRCITLTLD